MASNDGALHVWDPDPGQRLLNFESEASPFTAFRPLPNPFTLAAATQESVWYTRNYRPHNPDPVSTWPQPTRPQDDRRPCWGAGG